MPAKTSQLQIRISPKDKARLRKLAMSAGMDVSSYLLSRALPDEVGHFAALTAELATTDAPAFVFAELHDLLSRCTAVDFSELVDTALPVRLVAWRANYLAAMVCDPAPDPAALSAAGEPTGLQATEPVHRYHPGRSAVSARTQLSREDIRRLFDLLDQELASTETHAELYLVGGAVMCLSLGARAATRDVDALFHPAARVREAAARVALRADVPPDWLNDAVKGWLSDRGQFTSWLELPHLTVFVAHPSYLLAMKCMAMRLGAEFQDLDDVRYLLRHLNITSADAAMGVVAEYFDEATIPVKTRLALEELLPPG